MKEKEMNSSDLPPERKRIVKCEISLKNLFDLQTDQPKTDLPYFLNSSPPLQLMLSPTLCPLEQSFEGK